MSAFGLLLSVLLGGASSVAMPAQITLANDTLRVSDLAKVPTGGDLILAHFVHNRSAMELSEDQRTALVRNRIPGVHFTLRHRGVLLITRGMPRMPDKHGPTISCVAAHTEIATGRYVTREDVTDTPCLVIASDKRLRYDVQAGAPFAASTIPAGSYLGILRLPDTAPVGAGQQMVLRTSVGPVVIERNVTTMQPGRHGGRMFVRTDDGKMLASRLAPRSDEEAE